MKIAFASLPNMFRLIYIVSTVWSFYRTARQALLPSIYFIEN